MLRAAESRYREAARLAATIASLAGSAWDRVPLHSLDSWQSARLASQVTSLQLLLARGADAYLTAVLDEQGLDSTATAAVNATRIAGVAGDGRSLVTLLDLPRIEAKVLIGNGMGAEQAFASARESLRLMAVTAVQDASRAADSVAMVARPSVDGYVRMLNTPSCSRCVVLAGRFYRWNAGFQRHPKCDCRHVPSNENISGDLRTNPLEAIKAGQVTGLSEADTRAILDDGADVSQVINAHRGLYTADAYGVQVKATQEGVTKRAVAGSRFDSTRSPRLRPEAIYAIAKDREDALRLLRRFGYLL